MTFYKEKVYKFLNSSIGGSRLIAGLILISIIAFAFETEFPENEYLASLSYGVAIIFGIEYLARIWVSDLDKPYSLKARLQYVFSFFGIIDLIAFLPVLIFPGANGSIVLRLLRLTRLFQIMKFKPITRGLLKTGRAIAASKDELVTSTFVCLLLIFLGAVLMHLVEGGIQPEAFGSIPRALWWSLATLTTVGYGDVYPITILGRLVAAFMAIVGIGAVALPAGILAAAFYKNE